MADYDWIGFGFSWKAGRVIGPMSGGGPGGLQE